MNYINDNDYSDVTLLTTLVRTFIIGWIVLVFGLILLREPNIKRSGSVTFYTFGGFGSTHSDDSGYHFHQKQKYL